MTLPTLCLHGWGLHGGIWAETLKSLPSGVADGVAGGVAAGVATLAPDLPGYGAVPMTLPYTAEALADALAATVPSGPFNLIGWSMGGMVALALAARHPDRVATLVLVGASPAFVNRPDWQHGLEPEVLAEFAASLRLDHQATLLRFLSLQARGGDAARAVIARLRDEVFRRGEPAAETLAAGLDLLRDADLRALAEQVRCPTLVVHGAHDGLCPPAAGRWLAGHIPGARLALHARAAHAPFLSHPHWFAAEVGAFLHG